MIPTDRHVPLLSEENPQGGAAAADENPRPLPNDPAAAVVSFDPSSMAVTSLVILLALFFIGFFSIFARRFFADGTSAGPRHPRGSLSSSSSFFVPFSAPGLDQETIRALPVLSYTAGKSSAVAVAGCVVCLCEFQEKERVKVIPACRHVFHPGCIDAWLVSRGSCPVCRCSEMFGSRLWGGGGDGYVCVNMFDGGDNVEEGGGGGGEFVLEVEEQGRSGEEEEEEGKVVGMGRSRSWCRDGGDRGAVSLRRTCSA